jgi:hypothetical protein
MLWCSLAGACDAATGATLVVGPSLVVGLLHLTPAPTEPVYLRFVGVFVGAVGLAYFYPRLRSGISAWSRVVATLEMTAGFRLAVAAFVTASVVLGTLGRAWLVVAGTDLAIAVLQLSLLRARWGRELSAEEPA